MSHFETHLKDLKIVDGLEKLISKFGIPFAVATAGTIPITTAMID